MSSTPRKRRHHNRRPSSRPRPADDGDLAAIEAALDEVALRAPSRRGWRERVAGDAVTTTKQMTILNLRLYPDDRQVLLAWAQRHGYTISTLLREGINALLDRHGVTPEEVPLSWRR